MSNESDNEPPRTAQHEGNDHMTAVKTHIGFTIETSTATYVVGRGPDSGIRIDGIGGACDMDNIPTPVAREIHKALGAILAIYPDEVS